MYIARDMAKRTRPIRFASLVERERFRALKEELGYASEAALVRRIVAAAPVPASIPDREDERGLRLDVRLEEGVEPGQAQRSVSAALAALHDWGPVVAAALRERLAKKESKK